MCPLPAHSFPLMFSRNFPTIPDHPHSIKDTFRYNQHYTHGNIPERSMVVCRMHIIFKVEKTACSFLLFPYLKFYGKVRNTIGRQQYAIVEDCTLGNGTLYLD